MKIQTSNGKTVDHRQLYRIAAKTLKTHRRLNKRYGTCESSEALAKTCARTLRLLKSRPSSFVRNCTAYTLGANEMIRIKTPNTTHLYQIGTQHGRIEVEANTRAQAVSIARKAGYEIHDVNMVG